MVRFRTFWRHESRGFARWTCCCPFLDILVIMGEYFSTICLQAENPCVTTWVRVCRIGGILMCRLMFPLMRSSLILALVAFGPLWPRAPRQV